MPSSAQQVVVPVLAVDVVEHGARRIGRIGGVDPAFGQPPEQKAVDGAEGQLAALGGGSGTFDLVQQPGELGGREIGVDQQAGPRLDQLAVATLAQLPAALGGAPVLPDDRPVDRLARGPVPEDDGLALVGDADGGDGAGGEACLGQGFAGDREGIPPDDLGVMLDPAGTWIVLLELALAGGDRPTVPIEDQSAGAGGALVERQDVTRRGHGCSPVSPAAPGMS